MQPEEEIIQIAPDYAAATFRGVSADRAESRGARGVGADRDVNGGTEAPDALASPSIRNSPPERNHDRNDQ